MDSIWYKTELFLGTFQFIKAISSCFHCRNKLFFLFFFHKFKYLIIQLIDHLTCCLPDDIHRRF